MTLKQKQKQQQKQIAVLLQETKPVFTIHIHHYQGDHSNYSLSAIVSALGNDLSDYHAVCYSQEIPKEMIFQGFSKKHTALEDFEKLKQEIRLIFNPDKRQI